ncbi:DsbA family oxidoreductase [Leucobacter sp. CSA1]|uniref:DsbA family oxidoreductase n=1 Tax=Leucobacter chromiisoli TaxID=2796471 RepID=A0A934Q510_9MICO|nr:DsbA family oxidoreductase [Leucobacter chromiisoli]MBK0418469.1 DsbA family oxidoreductase [Leucobacter chromiisoli]
MTEKIRVDIWSDIACPWCYIGKHRFEQGVSVFAEQHPDVEIEVESHSYELAPDTPEGFSGGEVDFLVKHKGMPRERVEEMLAEMTRLGASDGIGFRFDALRHVNTRRAHRLLHLAKAEGRQAEVQERLFAAYFAEGEDLSDPETLAALAAEAGLDREAARAALDDESLGDAVDADITRARMLGVSGVPFFLFDQKYAVPGAQPADTFADVLGQVLQLARGDERRDAR